MSTHGPWLLKLEVTSPAVVEPTVMALAADAGDTEHASLASLPAATTTLTPAATAFSTASFSAADDGPPSDIKMTAVQ